VAVLFVAEKIATDFLPQFCGSIFISKKNATMKREVKSYEL